MWYHLVMAELCFVALLFLTVLFWYEFVGVTRMIITDIMSGDYTPSILAVVLYLLLFGVVLFATYASIGAIGLQFYLF